MACNISDEVNEEVLMKSDDESDDVVEVEHNSTEKKTGKCY